MNTKIALSGLSILASLVLIGGATFAFFNDTETSTGNTFTAGAIDLKVDNTSYALDFNIPGFVGTPSGQLVANPNNSWSLADLTIQKFFNFTDVKPGDYGEDTISLHVNDNDAWICAAANITEDADNSITGPEDAEGGPAASDGTTDGDLDSAINFAFWKDDGDNVLETDEVASIFLAGPISNLGGSGKIALADSTGGPLGPGPVDGGTDVYIGKGWCFGTMTPAALAQDGLTTDGPIAPGRTGTGFTCNGAAQTNIAQTDSVVGDLQFYAVQSRNNANFTCAANYTPTWEQ